MKTVAIIGSGAVGKTLAQGFLTYGHPVVVASRSADKRAELEAAIPGITTADFAEAAKQGDIIVLAVKGHAAEEAVTLCGPQHLAGKTVIDATNPIDDSTPPTNGVLHYFTNFGHSLMETLQLLAPEAHFVKAFNSVGSHRMVNPVFAAGKPSMFICGNHETAKAEVRGILDQFGWETEDMGGIEAARAIEPLAMLWCIPGFRENRWGHAFKLLQ
ncbi:MAG: NADPH-dependent F420 reductase [Saprospiraceae bacterium]